MRKPSKLGFNVGVKVEFRKIQPAYYSGYAGNPVVNSTIGMLGVVAATDVPYVWPTNDRSRGDYFVCVDVKLPGVYSGNPRFKQDTWRFGVNPRDIKIAKKGKAINGK